MREHQFRIPVDADERPAIAIIHPSAVGDPRLFLQPMNPKSRQAARLSLSRCESWLRAAAGSCRQQPESSRQIVSRYNRSVAQSRGLHSFQQHAERQRGVFHADSHFTQRLAVF